MDDVLSRPLKTLKGCGPIKANKMKEVGVLTLGDLLKFQGTIPVNCPVEQWKTEIQSLISGKTSKKDQSSSASSSSSSVSHILQTSEHSWFGMIGHYLYASKTDYFRNPRRVLIGNLVFTPYGFVISVCWLFKGKWITRPVSPLLLAITSCLWCQHEIVSSDSNESDDEEFKCWYDETPSILPEFVVTNEDFLSGLNSAQKQNLDFIFREVHAFQLLPTYLFLCLFPEQEKQKYVSTIATTTIYDDDDDDEDY